MAENCELFGVFAQSCRTNDFNTFPEFCRQLLQLWRLIFHNVKKKTHLMLALI